MRKTGKTKNAAAEVPTDSPGSVTQSPDDMSPAPDANAAAKIPDEDLLHICFACGDRIECEWIGGKRFHRQCDGCRYDKTVYFCSPCHYPGCYSDDDSNEDDYSDYWGGYE